MKWWECLTDWKLRKRGAHDVAIVQAPLNHSVRLAALHPATHFLVFGWNFDGGSRKLRIFIHSRWHFSYFNELSWKCMANLIFCEIMNRASSKYGNAKRSEKSASLRLAAARCAAPCDMIFVFRQNFDGNVGKSYFSCYRDAISLISMNFHGDVWRILLPVKLWTENHQNMEMQNGVKIQHRYASLRLAALHLLAQFSSFTLSVYRET